jgi:site-specific DNA recombinase
MKTIIYQRVSTARQAIFGYSLENQESRLREYAKYHNFDEVLSISDEGYSGRIINRPGFQKLLKLVQTRNVNAVIVYSLSRFARNTIDTLQAIQLLDKYSVTFHSLRDNIDTSTAIGRFFLTTLSALAQLEIEQTGERISSVLQYKKKKMQRVGQIPFGWNVDENKNLMKIKSEQYTINLITKLRDAGHTFDEVAKELTRKKRKNKANNVKWFKSQVHRIYTNTLANEFI